MNVIRKNLMSVKGYSPYCGNNACQTVPRTKFNGEQFVCPHCGWVSQFDESFIIKYKKRWNIQDDKIVCFITPTSDDNSFEKLFLNDGQTEKPYFEISDAGFGSFHETSHSTISGRYSSNFPNIQLIAKNHPKLTFLSVIDDQKERLLIWKNDYNKTAHSKILQMLMSVYTLIKGDYEITKTQLLKTRGDVK